jgi:hypothetical protein
VSWTNGASGTANPFSLTLQTNVSIGAIFAELITTDHATPYWWLASYGFTNNFETAARLLGANGLPLWQSYLAGLNPTDASSQLRLAVSRIGPNTNVLSWNATTGRVYTLWWSTDATGLFTRVPGASNLTASVTRLTNAPGSSRTFYRIEVQKP